MAQVPIRVHDDARPLHGISVLVRVAGHAGDTVHAKVKVGNAIAQFARKRQDEAAEAAIHVQAAIEGFRKLCQRRDVVNDALREAGSGAVQHDRVGADRAAHGRH
eukprot:7898132-Prorocentrum_lima.AAC.1